MARLSLVCSQSQRARSQIALTTAVNANDAFDHTHEARSHTVLTTAVNANDALDHTHEARSQTVLMTLVNAYDAFDHSHQTRSTTTDATAPKRPSIQPIMSPGKPLRRCTAC